MITPGELALLRSDFAQWMTDEASLTREVTVNTGGRPTHTTATVWTGGVRRRPASESRGAISETPVGDRAGVTSYWLFTFPAGVDVHGSDRIVCAGRTYEVETDLDKTTEVARYVMAKEFPGAG